MRKIIFIGLMVFSPLSFSYSESLQRLLMLDPEDLHERHVDDRVLNDFEALIKKEMRKPSTSEMKKIAAVAIAISKRERSDYFTEILWPIYTNKVKRKAFFEELQKINPDAASVIQERLKSREDMLRRGGPG